MNKYETLTLPKDFIIRNIIDDGQIYKNGKIIVDKCLAEEIKQLWSLGIHTMGCCCGHNKEEGFIQVERTDFQKMLDLGYQWYHDYPDELGGKYRHDAFIPKSKCYCEESDK